MTRWDVVGVGENSVDVVYGLAGRKRCVSPGGQVATTLCTCAALGLRAAYVGTFGHDENARLGRDELERRGVHTGTAWTRYAPNRCAVILVDERGDRTVFWQRDPALRLRPEEIVPDVITRATLLHVDNVDEDAAIRAARIARDAGMHVTTDIDQVTPRTMDLVRAATIPILAEHVPHALTGDGNLERALRTLGGDRKGMMCVTLGARGAMLLDEDRLHHASALAVDTVDTTGAGDVFRGAFIYALLRGDAPEGILRYANAAAAASCTRAGAIGGVPTLEEVDDYFFNRTNPSGGTTSETE